MKKPLLSLVFGALFSVTSGLTFADDWQPPGPIKLMVAFAAGGGADTQARLIAEELENTSGWSFIPENVTGKGGINLLNAMKGQPADGTVIGMVVSESLGYNRIAAQGANLSHSDFTPLRIPLVFRWV